MSTQEDTKHELTKKEYEVQSGEIEANDKEVLEGVLDNLPPILVGVAGGSASGKTTLCNKIIQSLGLKNCVIVSFDSFYKTPPPGTVIADYNFDHPDALDFELCHQVIKDLLVRKTTKIPEYCFKTHRRLDKWQKLKPNDLILLEGILAFHDPNIVQLMNLRIFVSCDDDIRLYRRVLRDVSERGREVQGVIFQYNRFVKPAFDNFIKPSAKVANIIVPGSHDNSVAINFICKNLRAEISKFEDLRDTVKSNVIHTDILDSRWLNIPENPDQLETAERIIYLRDPSSKNECIKLFNLFADKFSKSLYQYLT